MGNKIKFKICKSFFQLICSYNYFLNIMYVRLISVPLPGFLGLGGRARDYRGSFRGAFCVFRVAGGVGGRGGVRGAEFAHANLRVCTFRGEKWVQELGEIGSKSPCARKPG